MTQAKSAGNAAIQAVVANNAGLIAFDVENGVRALTATKDQSVLNGLKSCLESSVVGGLKKVGLTAEIMLDGKVRAVPEAEQGVQRREARWSDPCGPFCFTASSA